MTAPAYDQGSAGFVGDDPITVYNNVFRRFWLPEGVLVPLLRTPELQLLGAATRSGSGQEQWIDRLLVAGPAGEPVLRVAIREDLDSFNASGRALRAGVVESLDIALDWLGGVRLTEMPAPDSYALEWGSVAFAVGATPARIGEAQAEMLVVEGRSARIIVISTAASGFGRGEAHLAAKDAHLDFALQLKPEQRGSCEGLLPELWGLRPISEGTAAMLEPPY